MPLKRKLNLERFKSTQAGLVEFATLIEQAEPSHAEKMLEAATEQDSEFVYHAMKKVVYFEELTYVDETILAEILSNTSAKLIAHALKDMDEEFRKHLLRHLSYRGMKEVMDEEDKMGEVTKPFVLGARRHILKTGRDLESQNKFIFETIDCPRLTHKKKKA